MSDAPEKDKVEQLLTELTEVTKEAQDLAVEVTEALRKERRIGVKASTSDPATEKPRRSRRRARRKP